MRRSLANVCKREVIQRAPFRGFVYPDGAQYFISAVTQAVDDRRKQVLAEKVADIVNNAVLEDDTLEIRRCQTNANTP